MLMLMIATQSSVVREGEEEEGDDADQPLTFRQRLTSHSWSVSPFGTTARAGDVRYRKLPSDLCSHFGCSEHTKSFPRIFVEQSFGCPDHLLGLPHDRSRYSTALPDIRDRLRDSTTEAFQSP
jgi:hypothetical protein